METSSPEEPPEQKISRRLIAFQSMLGKAGIEPEDFDYDDGASLYCQKENEVDNKVSTILGKARGIWTDEDCHVMCFQLFAFSVMDPFTESLHFICGHAIPSRWWHEKPKTGAWPSLLHLLARQIAQAVFWFTDRNGAVGKFTQLLAQAVESGVELHAESTGSSWFCTYEDTALTCLINACDNSGLEPQPLGRHIDQALYTWASTLKAVGVDLAPYGTTEHDLLTRRGGGSWHSLITFNYGAEPADWRLVFKHPGDAFAGEFWDMVEHPERLMPGAWIDDVHHYDQHGFIEWEYYDPYRRYSV